MFSKLFLGSLLFAASFAWAQEADKPALKPFTSDGCSLFPDRALIGKADWCTCCFAHDIEYWQGGTQEQRLEADQKLRACVLQASNNAALADLMFAGVRAGGGPYYLTTYRWGYGWRYGRGYQALSEAEQTQAQDLLAHYFASGSYDRCTR